MNDETHRTTNDRLLGYQVHRFRDLMEEIVQCCQMRTAYLSDKFDLPQAELRCLLLFQDEKYLTVKGIAKKLDVAKSRVTKIIEGLLQKNLVESISDPQDARIKLISLTASGKAKCEEIGLLIMDLHRRLLLELGLNDRKAALASLELLRTSMETIKKELL
jgi:DNA-binding MarR family transcriptional regulator